MRLVVPSIALVTLLAGCPNCNPSEKPAGSEGGPCRDDLTCDDGLVCVSASCVKQEAKVDAAHADAAVAVDRTRPDASGSDVERADSAATPDASRQDTGALTDAGVLPDGVGADAIASDSFFGDAHQADGGSAADSAVPGDSSISGDRMPASDSATATDAGQTADSASPDSGQDAGDNCSGEGFEPVVSAARYFIDSSSLGDVWTWTGSTAQTPPVDTLTIENWVAYGGPSTTGVYNITANEASYETCGFCLILERNCNAGNECQQTFMPKPGGTFALVTLDKTVGGTFAGSMSNVTMQEVTIDQNLVTTPVPGGATWCLPFFSWSGTLP